MISEEFTHDKSKKSETKKDECCIHEEVEGSEISDILEKVCVKDEPLIKHTDGKYYCFFHLPTKEKDKEKFTEIIETRLKTVEKSLDEIEKLPKEEQRAAKRGLYYDFRYVWFPSKAPFRDYKFRIDADFKSASFSDFADFKMAVFSADADFELATFRGKAHFGRATFEQEARFKSAKFQEEAEFAEAAFSGKAHFGKASFKQEANFKSAKFQEEAEFTGAVFSEFKRAYFKKANFSKDVLFDDVQFNYDVSFNSSCFGKDSDVIFRKTNFAKVVDFQYCTADGYLRFSDLKLGEGSRFEFQEAAFENASRISFHSVDLQPSWFIDIDSREFVFNNVTWQDIEIDTDRKWIDDEVESLINRKIKMPEKALIKVFDELSDNAKDNHRFKEAEKFRKQSIALNNHKCYIHEAIDEGKKSDIRKEVCWKFPVVNENGGNYYCLLHNPDKNKAEVFFEEFEKLRADNHTDFRAVIFPISIEYTGDLPDKLDFKYATFQRRVAFENAKIKDLDFKEAYFGEEAELFIDNSTCTGEIVLDKAVFEGKFYLKGKGYDFFGKPKTNLSLKDASEETKAESSEDASKDSKAETLEDASEIPKTDLSLKGTRFERPNLVNFRSVRLRPHYFVDVDPTKFVFHDCHWKDENGKKLNITEEIKKSSGKAIAQVCNQLAVNYEEARNFEDSSYFRYTAMEATHRGFAWQRRVLTLNWWYKWTSGYGEQWWRAAIVLVSLLMLFGSLYATVSTFDYGERKPEEIPQQTTVGKSVCGGVDINQRFRDMNWCEATVHSLFVAALQRPEPKPFTTWTKFFVILETILAPLQAALLALAIRRKFMR